RDFFIVDSPFRNHNWKILLLNPVIFRGDYRLSLKPGDDIPVFINPENHSDTVLVNGASKARRSHHLALLLGGVLLGLIWLALVGMIAP
ncbi:MAG: hypothetical protein AB2533_15170, partial [Candidatus Thiodiazotropha endolucinida]